MRLINVTTGELEEFFEDSPPPYAILSHTWGTLREEVSFQEFRDHQTGLEARPGYAKILVTCRIAASQGLNYAWVDTCCIDKSSSAELSEAINSMFRWYQEATVCYVFLADLEEQKAFQDCRWFTRGWCLQELLAPKYMEFYNAQWNFIGTKSSLSLKITTATGINESALKGLSLDSFTIARKMGWAATRKTTRREDIAYSLLGIFEVNMPLLYGEGDKAFLRLQEHIIASSDDPSIFEWCSYSTTGVSGLLASSPKDFEKGSSLFRPSWNQNLTEYSITNRGITFSNTRLWADVKKKVNILDLYGLETHALGIYIQKMGPQQYIRIQPFEIAIYNIEDLAKYDEGRITIPKRLTSQTLKTISMSTEHMIDIRTDTIVRRLRCILGEPNWDSGRQLFMRMRIDNFLGVLSFSLVLDGCTAEYVLICYINDGIDGQGYVRVFILPVSVWPQFKPLIEHCPSAPAPRNYHNLKGWDRFFSAFNTTSGALGNDPSDRSFCLDKRVSCLIHTTESDGRYAGPLEECGPWKRSTIEISV